MFGAARIGERAVDPLLAPEGSGAVERSAGFVVNGLAVSLRFVMAPVEPMLPERSPLAPMALPALPSAVWAAALPQQKATAAVATSDRRC